MSRPCPTRLILHAGTNKTGTSSIQETLFFSLADPRYRYIGFGEVNGSRALQCLVGRDPAHYLKVQMGLGPDAVHRLTVRFHRRWLRAAARARRMGSTPIISAEDCWGFRHDSLSRLKDMITAEGYVPHVVIYLRPPLSFVSSAFQQRVKTEYLSSFSPIPANWLQPEGRSAYRRRLLEFDEVFGSANIAVRCYRRDLLAGGCVAQDFLSFSGITFDASTIRRDNDGLSLDATRLRYAYNRFGRKHDRFFWHVEQLLRQRLQEVPGVPFRLHPEVLDPVLPMLHAELRFLQERYNIDLSEDWTTVDSHAVRTEADLFRFSRASLDWLAEAANARPIRGCEGPEVAELVSRQVSRLRFRPTVRGVTKRVQEVARRELRRILAGN